MALDARKMTTEIRNALLKGKDVDKDTKKMIDESWYKICNVIVKHIQNNSEVQINFPVEPNAGTIRITENGEIITSGSYDYMSSVR